MRKHDKHFYKGFISGILVCALLIGVLALSGCLGGFKLPVGGVTVPSQNSQELSGDFKEIEEKLIKIQNMIDLYYLADEEIDPAALAEGIYKGYVDAIGEKYSTYYSAEEYADVMQSMSGTYSGIGALLTQNIETGVITIVRPFAGSPSEEAGMLKDDVLSKVEGQEVTGEDLTEVVARIKGDEGTTVEIEYYRPSEDKYYTVQVERRSIEVPTVEAEMLEDNIGYISILEFEEVTGEQFAKAVDDLSSQGMQALVLDLRDNPGGLVDASTQVLDRILPKDKLLVYTIDKNQTKEEEFSKDDDVIDVPIAVLTNDNTASASEIVSGCLQDYDRATLVGETTFGKGIVQYVIGLEDGSAVKLTGAKYYTPEGRNIHGTGIAPDVEVELDNEAEGDEQLNKAVEILLEETGK